MLNLSLTYFSQLPWMSLCLFVLLHKTFLFYYYFYFYLISWSCQNEWRANQQLCQKWVLPHCRGEKHSCCTRIYFSLFTGKAHILPWCLYSLITRVGATWAESLQLKHLEVLIVHLNPPERALHIGGTVSVFSIKPCNTIAHHYSAWCLHM